jgi:hypothetical protein
MEAVTLFGLVGIAAMLAFYAWNTAALGASSACAQPVDFCRAHGGSVWLKR